ncbi:MAG: hypothetical protein QG622_2808 [Actinomycetota bacterium]|nr:hypothetical protein [Actinomycetota bacterium]
MSVIDEASLTHMLGPWRTEVPSEGERQGPRALPLGERLGRRLVVLVDEGALPAGVRLPTERALAVLLGVSRSTATAGYRFAREAGRIESRQGSGSRVREPRRPPDGRTGGDRATGGRPGTVRLAGGRPGTAHPGAVPARIPAGSPADPGSSAFSALGRPRDGVIDLSLAETRCDGHTRAVLEQLGPDWLTDGAHGTGYHPQGLAELRESLAGYLSVLGHHARPDHMMITTGAQQGIVLTAAVTCPPGATVLVEEATYPGALEAFRRQGLRVVPVPCDRHGPDPAALAELLARTRPALVYLIPVGNNPTGVVIPSPRLDALADALSGSTAVLLEDRTAAPLADPSLTPAPLTARLPRGSAVVVGSMSKIAWSGVRVGWVVAPPGLMRDLLSARISGDLAGSAVAQLLATRLVPHLPRLGALVRADVAAGQAALTAALADRSPGWDTTEPDAGAWRWVRVPLDARVLARAAASAGVLVTPGPAFSPHAVLTDHLRLACVDPPEVLAEGVERLRRAFATVEGTGPEPDDGRDLLLI